MSDLNQIVSVAQAATHFNCNRLTIYRRIADGTLPSYHIGRSVRVNLAEAERALVANGNYCTASQIFAKGVA